MTLKANGLKVELIKMYMYIYCSDRQMVFTSLQICCNIIANCVKTMLTFVQNIYVLVVPEPFKENQMKILMN